MRFASILLTRLRRFLLLAAASAALLLPVDAVVTPPGLFDISHSAAAQNESLTPDFSVTGFMAPPGSMGCPATAHNACFVPFGGTGYVSSATPITGNGTGSTGAVTGTLAGTTGKTTYICGFSVGAIGSATAAVGPITIANLTGSSMVFQFSATTTGAVLTQTFTPCIPASATNTAITITTTADATASAVDVNSWGFQL